MHSNTFLFQDFFININQPILLKAISEYEKEKVQVIYDSLQNFILNRRALYFYLFICLPCIDKAASSTSKPDGQSNLFVRISSLS